MNSTAISRLVFTLFFSFVMVGVAKAHMPWLATDDEGHVIMWFGESPAERTYQMPKKIAEIELTVGDSDVATEPVDHDALIGIRSVNKLDAANEISGVVTYGLYHGTKLTYHVEHLPHTDPGDWPIDRRPDAPLQSIIAAAPAGSVSVTILLSGKPAKDIEVKLYCPAGHEEAAATTDIAGMVTFKASAVESGLNAIVAGYTNGSAKGTYNGENYGSTTDYLTATFRIPDKASELNKPEPNSEPKSNRPVLDTGSGVSIVPSKLPELPEALTSFGAAISGDKIYVYGGHTGEAHSYSTAEQSNRLWCLDVSAGHDGNWEQLSSGPSLQGLGLVADGERVVRIGGFTAVNASGDPHDLHSQTSVAAYNPVNNRWTELPALPEPRSSHDAAVIGDAVYVVGGWNLGGQSDDHQWHDTAWKLNLRDDDANWQPIAKPPSQRRAISVAAYHEKLFVIGGMTSKGKPTTQVEVYDPGTDTWTAGPSLPGSGMSGFGSSSFASGNRLYVSAMDGFLHQLSSDHQSWTTVAKSEPARFFHRLLPIGDQAMLLIGGANMEIGKFTKIDRIELR